MSEADALWAHHHGQWRDPAHVAAQWSDPGDDLAAGLLRHRVRGAWWELLERLSLTLIVSREYEHLLVGLSVSDGEPHVSYFRLPHPSGLAADREQGLLYVASTRNPNQVLKLEAVRGILERADVPRSFVDGRPLVPTSADYYPGSLYMHDLALIDGELHANAVGENTVVRLDGGGRWTRVWWPKAIERAGEPDLSRNYLQLNSIAAGPTVHESFYSASTDRMSRRRPGHLDFPVDKRGVVFSGRTREPILHGLTRPHSARLRQGTIWVDNSGYGELGFAEGPVFSVVQRLPGWTRGLCLVDEVAFVGTSRVIPRFRRYAPGLDVETSTCGVHAVDLTTGEILGSITWPTGNQIFAIEWLPSTHTVGFPFAARRAPARERLLFYGFYQDTTKGSLE